jgi:hypothetical protein
MFFGFEFQIAVTLGALADVSTHHERTNLCRSRIVNIFVIYGFLTSETCLTPFIVLIVYNLA